MLSPSITRPCHQPSAVSRTASQQLAEGVLGTMEELLFSVGDSVNEDDVVAVVETDLVAAAALEPPTRLLRQAAHSCSCA